MNIQKRRIFETSLFSATLTLVSFAAPVLAAPTDTTLPATQVKLTTASPVLKPTTLKTLAPVIAKNDHASAKRHSDYRYSNPIRWHSDMTANSIRNQ